MFKTSVSPSGTPELIVFVGNPTQYHSPIFREIYKVLNGKMEVLYGDSIGAEPFYNPELSSVVEWDVPLLDGFGYKIFKNKASSDKKGFWSRNNPEIFKYVYNSKAQYTLIHGYDTLTSWYVYAASILSRKKIIWRGEAVERPNAKKSTLMLKKIILPIYFSFCSKVLYSCTRNRNYLEKYVFDKSKLESFPCAVDYDFFYKNRIKNEAVKNSLKKELGFKEKDFIYVTCSRLTKRKRVELIIENLADMKYKDVGLLVIGGGPEQDNLLRLAKSLGVKTHITGFVGQKEVAQYLSIGNCFTLLSSYDASPKALNESLIYDMPLVVSDGIGTSDDLVKDYNNGFIVNNNNINILNTLYDEIYKDPFFDNKLIPTNEFIRKSYSIKKDVKAIYDIIYNK